MHQCGNSPVSSWCLFQGILLFSGQIQHVNGSAKALSKSFSPVKSQLTLWQQHLQPCFCFCLCDQPRGWELPEAREMLAVFVPLGHAGNAPHF